VPLVFPDHKEFGEGVYNVTTPDLEALNRGLAELIGRGALLSAVGPAYSALERQFREAIGERVA
jgi:hypothetical protein